MSIKTFAAVRAVCEYRNWEVSNLAVHKILYIAHKIYMGRNSESAENLSLLVNSKFQAWLYGPVLPNVYYKLKMFGADNIEPIYALMDEEAPDEEKTEYITIAGVCEALENVTPGQMVAITHHIEGAWHKYYGENAHYDVIIPNKEIYYEYKRDKKRRSERSSSS